jgi:DNA-binding IclR family transcriptional regulator
MACVNPDGTLSPSALSILAALSAGPIAAPEIARRSGLPLYRIRSSIRELVSAGLVNVDEKEETYQLTEAGAAKAKA